MIDGTHIHAIGTLPAQKGRQKQALGRSRGGFTKFHVTVDALGNPFETALTGGRVADIGLAAELLEERNNIHLI